jgi:peptidyl-prolyl cis-trans isomerase B (cyclophilin B)
MKTMTNRQVSLAFVLSWAATLVFGYASAYAQITPDRLYNGKDRPIPMTVKVPTGMTGEPVVQLLAAGTGDVKASQSVVAGKVDLAALFPTIWKPESGAPALFYAQLAVGGKKVGPAVVVQPTTNFKYARFDPRDEWGFAFTETQNPTYSGVRTYVDKYVVMETTAGSITFALRPDKAPNTAFNMLHLVEGGFYTDIPFHRIVPTAPSGNPFVIQAGDPAGNAEGGPGYFIDLEQSDLPHDFGVISMARMPDPNSAGSQFFICLSREGTLALDGRYTSFGYAVKGGDVIVKISQTKLDPETQKPIETPVIKSARTIDAEPYSGAPAPAKRPDADAGDKAR